MVVGLAGYNVSLALNTNENCDAELKTIEALAEDESTYPMWSRSTNDCEHTFTGKIGAKIDVPVGGVTVATLTIGSNGTATYTYGSGEVICTRGGQSQCSQQNCPTIGSCIR
jgi:hypothetical protein